MKISEVGVDLIKRFESCRLRAYLDGGGVPTIGWGHTRGVHMHDVWTQERADQQLEDDLIEFEGYVNALVKVPLTQNQFDALMSFCYNVGPDIDADTIAEGLGDSTLLRKLNAGNYDGAADEFSKWVKDNGIVVRGLVNRRNAERDLFVA